MQLLRKAGIAFDFGIDGLSWVAGGILVACWAVVCTEVFMRYFLNRPQIWVVTTAEIMLVFITFLGSAWVLKREAHVTIDIVLKAFSPRKRALIITVTSAVCAVACLVAAWYGGEACWNQHQRNIHMVGVLRLPTAPLFAAVVIGTLFTGIQFVRRAYGNFGQWRSLARGVAAESGPEIELAREV